MTVDIASPSLVRITREPPPTRVHVAVTTPTGRHYRWGRDEPRGEDIPSGLRWSTTAPGGYETLDVTLARSPRHDYADLAQLSDIRVLGPGGRVAGEYRLEGEPVTSGDQMAINPSAVGWQANLSDNGTASLLVIDRDLSKWLSSTLQRQGNLANAYFAPANGSAAAQAGYPAGMQLQITSLSQQAVYPGTTSANASSVAETFYDAGAGMKIGEIRSDYYTLGMANNWDARIIIGADPNFPTWRTDPHTTVATGVSSASIPSTVGNGRYALLTMLYPHAYTGPDGEWDLVFLNLRVIGATGIPIVGASPAVEGAYASDIVKYIVTNFAPMLRCDDSTIQHSNYIIPQAAWTNTDPGTMLTDVLKYGIPTPDWFVWDNRTFYLHDQGTRNRRWRARIGPTQLGNTGPDLTKQWNSVLVTYTDVDSTTKTVGPPGSGADVEDASLVDLSPANVLNQVKDFQGHQIMRRAPLTLGTSTSSIATQVGAEFLSKANGISLAGQAQHVGWIEDFDTGVLHPYHAIRAGDQISYSDASDTSFRRVSRTDNDDGTRTNSVSLDAPADSLQGVIERLAAEIISVGLG